MNMNGDIYDILTTQFLIWVEKIRTKGEDSGLVAFNGTAGLLGVFDGCGGLGSLEYPNINDKSGAYLASRAVANAAYNWFVDFRDVPNIKEHTAELRNGIDKNLQRCLQSAGDPGFKIKGSLFRSFPSTMAVTLYQKVQNQLVTAHIWAGDSRTYLLGPDGMRQVSKDDVRGEEDALSNLTDDGILANVISADHPYELHIKQISSGSPVILISATDGCFGYLTSPMRFEALILSTLMNSRNAAEWQEALQNALTRAVGDDVTLALAALGFSDFEEIKQTYRNRAAEIIGIADAFDRVPAEEKQKLWDDYRKIYYQFR